MSLADELIAVVLADGRPAGRKGSRTPFVASDGEALGKALAEVLGKDAVAVLIDERVDTSTARRTARGLARRGCGAAVVAVVGRPAETVGDVTGTSRRAGPLRATLAELDGLAVTLLVDPREGSVDASSAEELVRGGAVEAVAVADSDGDGSQFSGVVGGGLFVAAVRSAFVASEPTAGAFFPAVDAGRLEETLSRDVNRMLRESFAAGRRQRPRVVSAAGFVPWPAAGGAANGGTGGRFVEIAFESVSRRPLRSYRQISKADRVPAAVTASSTRFVQGRIGPAVADDLEALAGRIRKALAVRRGELTVQPPVDGAGSVICPDFEYRVEVGPDPDAPADVLTRERVDRFETPAAIQEGRYDTLFPDGFEAVVSPPRGALSVAAVIDRLESAGGEVRRIDYPSDASRVRLELAGTVWSVEVSPEAVRLEAASRRSPSELLAKFHTLLTDRH
ncbi:MAG: hypothetical protein AAF532_03195 [Planctomycetota bacterium]